MRPGPGTSLNYPTHVPLEELRLQARDLYVPAGDIGMWQGALRNPDDEVRAAVVVAMESHQPITVELLYSDQVGRQRTISRFGLMPVDDTWLATLSRHWYLDWEGPRPDSLTLAASEAIRRDHEAASQRRAAAENEQSDTDSGGSANAESRREDLEAHDPPDARSQNA